MEVEEVNKGKNIDLYQESRAVGNEEPLATISKVPNTQKKIEEESAQEIDFTQEATAQAIVKEKEKKISYEKMLASYLRSLHHEAEDLYNESYQDYYLKILMHCAITYASPSQVLILKLLC